MRLDFRSSRLGGGAPLRSSHAGPGSLSGTDLARVVEDERFTIIFKPYRVTELAERLHALLQSEDRSPVPEERRAARIA
jgi:hypothetical protein